MSKTKNTIAFIASVIAAITPVWAALHPEFIPIALVISPIGLNHIIEQSKNKGDATKENSKLLK
ncbi:hypothetical protein A6S26_34595 [Nostoc sp. ATCC 43529]|nr:hypothetical protein A6S26_34595 [Nostoc sp. ATCC 43529]